MNYFLISEDRLLTLLENNARYKVIQSNLSKEKFLQSALGDNYSFDKDFIDVAKEQLKGYEKVEKND